MKRVMVNFSDEMGLQVEARAKAEKRSMSAHLVMLAEKDLKSAGLLSSQADSQAELRGAVKEVGVPRALAAIRALPRRKPAKKHRHKEAA